MLLYAEFFGDISPYSSTYTLSEGLSHLIK